MRYVLLFVQVMLVSVVLAQPNPAMPSLGTGKIPVLNLPPIDSLYVWAELNSANIRIQDALIEKTDADLKRIKKQWLDAFKFGANIKTGSYGNEVINQVETGYSYGPYVSFSLYEIAGHHNLVDVYRAEGKVATSKKDQAIFELRRIVWSLFNDIQLHKSILEIRSESVNSAYVHVKMAEKEFSEGAIALGELSRVTEIYSKAQTDLVLTINDLRTSYMELEQLCGKSLNENTK